MPGKGRPGGQRQAFIVIHPVPQPQGKHQRQEQKQAGRAQSRGAAPGHGEADPCRLGIGVRRRTVHGQVCATPRG